MSTTMSLFWLVTLTLLSQHTNGQSTPPNIVFILFDDLGFNDVSYNGGTYPTPVLDKLANHNAIKFNSHYAEPLCSASRSALFTGRYAWLSGLNSVSKANSHKHFSPTLTLYPQLLQKKYNTFIAGKWHIGYKYSGLLPGQRGFDEGLYALVSSDYYSRESNQKVVNYDDFPTSDAQVIYKLSQLLNNDMMLIHDLWGIDEDGEPYPALEDNKEYVEDVYTDAVIEFIERQSADTPFYVHYNLWTPHAAIEEPPALSSDFEHTYEAVCDAYESKLGSSKAKFCRIMLYAQQKITEIVDVLTDLDFWDNTLIVIASDNGPTPETLGKGYGQALPLRGVKGTMSDGGLRTMAMLVGGYVTSTLHSLESATSVCEYNELLHISDFFHLLTDVAGVEEAKEFRDSDHEHELWADIQCKCDAECVGTERDADDSRTELLSMGRCGDAIHSGMLIRRPWKLVVNASYGISSAQCEKLYDVGAQMRNAWVGYDKFHQYMTPNQAFFDDWYYPQVTGEDAERGRALYESACLENLDGTDEINNASYAEFQYTEQMLFNVETDKIEACNKADAGDPYEHKREELMSYLEQRSREYAVPASQPLSVGSLWAQVRSYDCETGKTYLVPWEGLNEDKCGEEGEHSVDNRDCADLWNILYNKIESCEHNERHE